MSTNSILLGVTIFLIASVEFIEMATIVISVGLTRGWFPTLLGGGVGLVILGGVVIGFGALLALLPLNTLRALIGILLLLFGIQWLRQSIYGVSREGFWSGEEEEEEAEGEEGEERTILGLDWVAFARGFQGVFLEGLEIAFVVVTFGSANNALGLAGIATVAAFVVIATAAILARNILAEIPEATLKFAVGILLSTYGTYWSAVGMGAEWPGGDLGVLYVLAYYTLFAFLGVYALRLVRREVITEAGDD